MVGGSRAARLSRWLSGGFIGNLSERALVFAGGWRVASRPAAKVNYSLCGAILGRPRLRDPSTARTGPPVAPGAPSLVASLRERVN